MHQQDTLGNKLLQQYEGNRLSCLFCGSYQILLLIFTITVLPCSRSSVEAPSVWIHNWSLMAIDVPSMELSRALKVTSQYDKDKLLDGVWRFQQGLSWVSSQKVTLWANNAKNNSIVTTLMSSFAPDSRSWNFNSVQLQTRCVVTLSFSEAVARWWRRHSDSQCRQ